MGCSESKIDNVRTVNNRCKERISFMKQSLSAHTDFVSSHTAFKAAHKNLCIALDDYTQSELQFPNDHPLPPHPPLQRDGTLAWDFFVALMKDVDGPSPGVVNDKHSGIEKPAVGKKSGRGVVKSGNLDGEGLRPSSMTKNGKVSRKLDDGSIKALRSACEVSKIHDANNLHCHSSFEDNQGKHCTRVMRVTNSAKVHFSSKEKENHATLLDTMLAWEKKLYDQVKVGEMMKHEYKKKIKVLNELRKRGVSSDRLKKTQAHVNDLHTRYIVEMQSIDSIVSEINRLRDEQLYPKLVQVVEEMEEMWKDMQKQHEQQLTIMQELTNIKTSQSPKNTSEHNLKSIEQIHLQVTIWSTEFEKLMLYQKKYIKSLNNWLKLNLIYIDSNVMHQNPKIESLLSTWNDQLKKLHENKAKTAINAFAAVIATIVQFHSTEMKMKQRCNEIEREITKTTRKFEDWCDKQISKRRNTDETDVDVIDDMDMIADQQVVVEVLEVSSAYKKHNITEFDNFHSTYYQL